MKKYKLYSIILIIISLFSCGDLNNPFLPSDIIEIDNSQKPATRGTDFYLAYSVNNSIGYPTELSFFVTCKNKTKGFMEIPSQNMIIDFTISANEVKKIVVPTSILISSNGIIEDYGIFIHSDNPVAITALDRFISTSDSFLVYPVQSLGSEYYAMSYKSRDATIIGSNFTILAAYDNTEVTITPSMTIGTNLKDVPYTIILNRLQTFRVSDTPANIGDITGSHIVSDFPVAVFSGNMLADVPIESNFGDYIEEQLPPVKYWGERYMVSPFQSRARYMLRVLASKNNTEVYFNGVEVAKLNAGAFHESILAIPVIVESDKPVLTAQFALGGTNDTGSSSNGDPFMIILPPERQFLNNYCFSTLASDIRSNYINITMLTSDIRNIKLDNYTLDKSLFVKTDSRYSTAKIPFISGTHIIKSDKNFGLLIYGFDSYDSYGHCGN